MEKAQILDVIARCVQEVLPDLVGHQFRHDDRLSALGANSIDRAEIVVLTLESLSLSLPKTAVAGAANLGEMADILHAALRGT